MDKKDYYKILGVDRKADEKAIKQAYRRLARDSHPDKHPGDKAAEERFKEINEAYQVLSDPTKRKQYDTFGSNWQQYQRAGGGSGDFDWSQWANARPGASGPQVEFSGDLNELFGQGGFADIFDMLGNRTAGGSSRSRGTTRRRGQNVQGTVEITLEEAAHGAERVVEVNGQPQRVRIPPGAHTGSEVTFTGKGTPGLGGEPGDLVLKVTVLPHERFERDGDNLRVTLPVNLYDAIFGAEVPVPTLDGQVVLKVPPGANSGGKLRLRGKGMPHRGKPDQRGDLIVQFQIQLPENLTDREKELFRELAQLRGKSV